MGCIGFLIDGQVLSGRSTSLLPGEGFLGWRRALCRSSGLEESTLQELWAGGEHLAGAQGWLVHGRHPVGHLPEQGSPSSWS